MYGEFERDFPSWDREKPFLATHCLAAQASLKSTVFENFKAKFKASAGQQNWDSWPGRSESQCAVLSWGNGKRAQELPLKFQKRPDLIDQFSKECGRLGLGCLQPARVASSGYTLQSAGARKPPAKTQYARMSIPPPNTQDYTQLLYCPDLKHKQINFLWSQQSLSTHPCGSKLLAL